MKTHTFMMSYSFSTDGGNGSGYDISKFRHAAEALTSDQVEKWLGQIRRDNGFILVVPITITPLADE